jgi:hypothetical protein
MENAHDKAPSDAVVSLEIDDHTGDAVTGFVNALDAVDSPVARTS